MKRAIRLLRAQQFVAGLGRKRPEVGDRAGVGGDDAERLAGRERLQRPFGAQNRQRAVQAAGVKMCGCVHGAAGESRASIAGFSRRRFLSLLTAAAAAPVAAQTGAPENEPLPELGDAAERVLSPTQERRIGDQFRRQLLRDRAYIADPEINAYLARLGAQIAERAALRGVPISVHLVRNSVLNAFAVPGGHITFHTGLILAAEDEDELAAVMAHEIAHIAQRHLPRMVAKMEASRLPAAAAILASIVVGGQAGLAGLTVANAALLSNQLAFTREFEREADAIGIRLLAAAGFDPAAMAGFFGKLEGPSGLGDEGPEYLRTHPLSFTRVAEAQNRAATYTHLGRGRDRAFFFIRAKIRALYADNPREALAFFQAATAAGDGGGGDGVAGDDGGGDGGGGGDRARDAHDAAVYGLALVQWRQRQFADARATLQPLLDARPGEIPTALARAEIDRTAGDPAAAVARYAALGEAGPLPAWLAHYQAEALIDAGDAAAARRLIRRQLRRHKSMFTLYRPLAKSHARLGQAAESHQASAEYHAALGEYPDAISALKRALAAANPDGEGYLHASVTARLHELEGILKQQLQP